MLELNLLIWLLAAVFAYIGWQRGWTKGIISLSGVMLGIFAMYQFDTLIRITLFGDLPRDQIFYLQSIIFLVIVYFAYETRALERIGANRSEQREELQNRVLGGIVGFINGYLIGGTIWYIMDINRFPNGAYPLDPYVVAPPIGSSSAAAINNLPVYLLTQNGASGDLLSLIVVVLFVVVLIMI